jgi:hypothetical protein
MISFPGDGLSSSSFLAIGSVPFANPDASCRIESVVNGAREFDRTAGADWLPGRHLFDTWRRH